MDVDTDAVLEQVRLVLRAELAEHRTQLAEQIGQLDGRVSTVVATKDGEHARLADAITAVEHRARTTDAAGLKLHDRLDVIEHHVNRARWIAAGLALGAGTTGGGVAVAVVQAINGA